LRTNFINLNNVFIIIESRQIDSSAAYDNSEYQDDDKDGEVGSCICPFNNLLLNWLNSFKKPKKDNTSS